MMQVSDRASPIEDRVEAMLAQLRPIATSTNPTHQALAGRLLADLRASVNGQFPALVRELRPDLARPDAWAKRLMAAHGEPSASALTAAVGLNINSASRAGILRRNRRKRRSIVR